jgi:outer membrane protein assembly factor BamB
MTRKILVAMSLMAGSALGLAATLAEGDGSASQPATMPARTVETDPAEGMMIDDARDAADKMKLAQQMERQKDWAQAVAGYQEVIAAYGSKAFPCQLDDASQAYQYTNFGQYLQDCIAGWPREGIDRYRSKYEASAKALLDAASPDDMAALDRICSQYFCTDAGKQAAMRMMDLQMETGDFAAAAMTGDRLLSAQPGLAGDRPAILYRTALAYCYGGDAKKAAELGEELKQQFPAAQGTVRGEQVVLADSLGQEIAAKPKPWTVADAWPMPGGMPSRGRIVASNAWPAGLAYSIAVETPKWAPNQPGGIPIPRFDRFSEGRTIGILPSVDRGELFFQDGHHVYGVDLASGAPLPGWLKTYPKGVYTLAGVTETSRGHQLSITLTDHQVLAIMAHPDQQGEDEERMGRGGNATRQGIYDGEPKLVCLDRTTGAELWTVALSKLPDAGKSARTMQMIGSPLVVGQEVLVTARGRNGLRDEELVYVLAFDLDTGAFRWSTFIAAHPPLMMGSFNFRSIPAEQAEVATHLAYANGMVYVQSNLGVLAALDPWVGQIKWLDVMPIGRTLPKTASTDPFWAFRMPRPFDHKPWSFNPVVIAEGRLFTMPSEGQLLHICNPQTGEELNRIDLARIRGAAPDPGTNDVMPMRRSSSFDTLVGIRGDTLVVASDRTLYCLDWKNYDPFAKDPLAGAITKWKTLLPTQTRGRAFMTEREILVPCQDRLYRLSPDTGKIIDSHPSAAPTDAAGDIAWKSPEEPGNVLAIGDKIVIAGADAVNVYHEQR